MIEGLDISHWQGTNINWDKMASAGIKFIYLKITEGTYYYDDTFANNYANARKVGLKVGAYHFVTTENPKLQYQWFKQHLQGRIYDLVPALDVETSGITQNLVDNIGKRLEQLIYQNPIQFGLTWTWKDTLRRWWGKLTRTFDYPHPAIYTNVSLGNSIFTNSSMNRYPLWIATRGLDAPVIPKIWKDKGYYIWQDSVTGGTKYGISGNVDHNIWGTFLPFPGDEPNPPPPPATDKIEVEIKIVDDGNYSGSLDKE